jgi:hypothetical protein
MPPGRVLMLCVGLCLVMAFPATVPVEALRLLSRNGVNGYPMGAAIAAALISLASWPFWCRHVLRNVMRSEMPEMQRFRAALLGASNSNPPAKTPV